MNFRCARTLKTHACNFATIFQNKICQICSRPRPALDVYFQVKHESQKSTSLARSISLACIFRREYDATLSQRDTQDTGSSEDINERIMISRCPPSPPRALPGALARALTGASPNGHKNIYPRGKFRQAKRTRACSRSVGFQHGLIVIPRTFDIALSSLCMPRRRLCVSLLSSLPLTVILIIFFLDSPSLPPARPNERG